MAQDLNELRAKLEATYAGAPQLRALAIGAIGAIEEGLEQLARLGHRLEVDWAGESPVLMWPKMIYKDGSSPRGVENQIELDAALADGWREHPSQSAALGQVEVGAGGESRVPATDESFTKPVPANGANQC